MNQEHDRQASNRVLLRMIERDIEASERGIRMLGWVAISVSLVAAWVCIYYWA